MRTRGAIAALCRVGASGSVCGERRVPTAERRVGRGPKAPPHSTRVESSTEGCQRQSRSRRPTTVRPSPLTSEARPPTDRKSTRLNSSHVKISYAVFCLKKKKKKKNKT